jgi:amidase
MRRTVSGRRTGAVTDEERRRRKESIVMPFARPALHHLQAVAADLGLHLSDEDLLSFRDNMADTFAAYDAIDALPDNLPPVAYPRTPGYRPQEDENPYNAWYVKTRIEGAPGGKLGGKTIALKDNICLAGVPMMVGASTLEGYTPDVDATVVTRLLDAGGTIVGKAHCEYFCFSGSSHTNATGPTHNPYKHGYSAGGSSSGCAALVAAGEVDIAIGCDQGGSIRTPASYCGVYGLKPTHGLVPYSGIMPIEITLDHVGPMTNTVTDNALALEVMAGPDGLDPRQRHQPEANYTQSLNAGVKGLRVAMVREAFGQANSEPEVDAKARASAERFRRLGATVDEVSIAMHRLGHAIWVPIATEGAMEIMMRGNGFGTGWRGLYVTSLLDCHAGWRARADELSETLKVTMLFGHYAVKYHRGHYYAKAQNLSRKLRAAYDAALDDYDLLLMPTLPIKATPLPPPGSPRQIWLQRGFEMIANTAPFDVTGHPALTLPCGMSDGLPIGLMLVAKHYDEATIYRAAAAFEASGDWKKM